MHYDAPLITYNFHDDDEMCFEYIKNKMYTNAKCKLPFNECIEFVFCKCK